MATYTKAPIVSLETERLRLRPLERSDEGAIQRGFANPNVVRYLATSVPWPYPDDGARTFLDRILPKIEAREEYGWAILRKGYEEEGLIGIVHLIPVSETTHRGFWLAEPFWGQGFMTEAVGAANDFAFDVLSLDEMRMYTADPNAGSQRLKESSGAEVVGKEEREYVGGRFPTTLWRLTAEAWRASRAR